MNLIDIYKEIDNEGIKLKNVDLLGDKAISVKTKTGYAIGIDNKAIKNEVDELMIISHEMGHGETLSFYNPKNILDIWGKHERKAIIWQIKKLVPEEELFNAVSQGYTEMWELAEYFNLPQEFIEKAVCYHEGLEWKIK